MVKLLLHTLPSGVKVKVLLVDAVVFIVVGDHVPVIPLSDVVGKTSAISPIQ